MGPAETAVATKVMQNASSEKRIVFVCLFVFEGEVKKIEDCFER